MKKTGNDGRAWSPDDPQLQCTPTPVSHPAIPYLGPRFRLTGVTLCLALASAVVGETPRTEPSNEVERGSWLGTVADGGNFVVTNRFGDVRARFGGYEGKAEVFATVQHFAAEGPRLAVTATESESGVEVMVGYYRETDSGLVTVRDPEQRKRVDLVVFVPLGVPLRLVAEHGLTEVLGVRGDVRAVTTSGDVILRSVAGDVDVRTVSGDVVAVLAGRPAAGEQSIVSETGELTVHLDDDAHLTVHAATNERISTDFSMEIDHQPGRRPARRGVAVVGKGTTGLRLISDGGRVRLVRRPSAQEARAAGQEHHGGGDEKPPASATARDEPVYVELGPDTPPRNVETVTGDITVVVAPGVDVTLRLATSGEMTVDFPIDVEHRHGQEPAKQGRMVVGDGTTFIDLKSRQGAIRVLRR